MVHERHLLEQNIDNNGGGGGEEEEEEEVY
jgi:hypothetical protein